MFMSEGYNGQVKILLDLHPESNNAIPKMAFIPVCKPLRESIWLNSSILEGYPLMRTRWSLCHYKMKRKDGNKSLMSRLWTVTQRENPGSAHLRVSFCRRCWRLLKNKIIWKNWVSRANTRSPVVFGPPCIGDGCGPDVYKRQGLITGRWNQNRPGFSRSQVRLDGKFSCFYASWVTGQMVFV